MKYHQWVCLAAAVLSGPGAYAALAQAPAGPPAAPLTLPQAWARATDYNKQIVQQRQQVAISEELVKDRRSERLPRLPVRGEYAYLGALYGYEVNGGLRHPEAVPVPPSPHFFTTSVGAELEVYTGGRIKNNIATAQATVTLDVARLTLTQQDVRLRVTQAYLDVRRNLNYRALTEGNVRVLHRSNGQE